MRKVLAVLLLLGLAACGSTVRSPTAANSSPPRVPTTTAPAPTTPPPTTVVPPSTAQPGRSAYDQLARFVQAAETMDQQLRHAAQLINGAGPPWALPLPATVVSSVQAADLQPLVATIPAGSPSQLMRQTILVYSDLASRRDAMSWFGTAGLLPNSEIQSELLGSLANGGPAAARFASDLAGLISTARDSPAFAPASPTSTATAEVLLLVQWTNKINGGCGATGGNVITTLPAIVWSTHNGASGTIGGVDFDAQLIDGAWQVGIHAC